MVAADVERVLASASGSDPVPIRFQSSRVRRLISSGIVAAKTAASLSCCWAASRTADIADAIPGSRGMERRWRVSSITQDTPSVDATNSTISGSVVATAKP